MRTILSKLIVGMVLVIMITVPVYGIDTQSPLYQHVGDVAESNGMTAPHVLSMWVQDSSPVLEDGDMSHMVEGTQFVPSCKYGDSKDVQVFLVINEENFDNALASVTAEIQKINGTYRDTIPCSEISKSSGISYTEQAKTAHLITYASGVSFAQVMDKLRNDSATVWKGHVSLPSTESAGKYVVTSSGSHPDAQTGVSLESSFSYNPVACLEFDFSSLDYGMINLGTENWIRGDDNYGTGEKPTVRKTGK